MIGSQHRRRFITDERAVSAVIGFILLFGLLTLTLAMYQVQVVPQQNAQAEYQHNQEVTDDMVALRNSISTAGQADRATFARVNLGLTYQTRLASINPPPATGTLRTSESYNITISNRTEEYDTNVSTRFIEYEPRYNEISTGSIWYENSVLYVDERDERDGRPVQILEDQHLVTNQSDTVRVTAVQNEFEESGTDRIVVELFPAEAIEGSDIPEGELDVIIPTRLNKSEYWDEQLGESIEIDEDFHADGVHRLNMSNSTVHSDDFEFNAVNLRERPIEEQPKQNVGPDSQRRTVGEGMGDDDTDGGNGDGENGEGDNGNGNGDDDNGEGEGPTQFESVSVSNIVANSDGETQTFTFSLDGDISDGDEVLIDLDDAQDRGPGNNPLIVDYPSATSDGTTIEIIQGSGSAALDQSGRGNADLTYTAGESGDTAGSEIEIAVNDIEVGDVAGEEYDVDFEGIGEFSDTTTFGVAESAGDQTVSEDSDGDVFSAGSITIEDGITFENNVTADDTVTLEQDAEVGGKITSGGDVDLAEESEVGDSIEADGAVELGEETEVEGEITSGGDVDLAEESEVGDSIEADGAVELGEETEVEGEITSGGDVDLAEESEVGDSIESDGAVELGEETEVEGEVVVESGENITCGDDATINEQSCQGYVNENY